VKSSNNAQDNLLHMAHVHDTATIHPEAEIGSNVKVGPYTIIGEEVKIGSDTEIGPHVVLQGNITVGKNNHIYHGAVLGVNSQNTKTNKGVSLEIGDNNIIRENVTIYTGGKNEVTRIGSDNFIMAYCRIAEGCQLGDNIIISNAVCFGSGVIVEDRAVIAGLCTVKEQVRIGKIAMVGGHSRVDKDVPPYMLVDGHNPLRIKVNIIGLRRNEFDPHLRKLVKKLYKIVYRSGQNYNIEESISNIQEQIDSSDFGPEINHFIAFLKKSQLGIVRNKSD